MPVIQNLLEKFSEYFELLEATTDELRQCVYALRYQVYCVETGFENKESCRYVTGPDNQEIYLESDSYDARSVHCLIRHRRTGVFAATTRIVLPDPSDYFAHYPIEAHCRVDAPITSIEARKHLGEVSRFAVSREFKRRQGEPGTLAGIPPELLSIANTKEERRILPHLTVGLISGLVQLSRQYEIRHWYAVMEPAFIRLLHRFGIYFDPIGPETEYHGIRQPSIIDVDSMLLSMRQVDPEVWDLVTQRGRFS